VHALDLAHGAERAPGVGEDQRQHQIERAPEAIERARAEVAVGGDAGGDERVRDLEEERPSAAEEDGRLPVDAPGDGLRAVEAPPRVDRAPAGAA